MNLRRPRLFILLLGFALWLAGAHGPAWAEGQGIVAVVNDHPVTELDVSQRITLLKIIGNEPEGGLTRKAALQSLVDEVVKIEEAKRVGLSASDGDITKQIERVASGMKNTPEGLNKLLAEKGISANTFRRYISAQIGFNRIIASKYRNDIIVQPGEVDRKMAEIKSKVDGRAQAIKNDPRMKAVTIYTIMEINLPVEDNNAADPQFLQARVVEAMQVAKQFSSCKNAKAAASGVFNVKFGKQIDADSAKLPKQMKQALDKAGPGHTIGPMRGKGGIQLLALCGTRRLSPQVPKFETPTRQQVENAVLNEKYATFEESYMVEARRKVYVEYRDPSVTQ